MKTVVLNAVIDEATVDPDSQGVDVNNLEGELQSNLDYEGITGTVTNITTVAEAAKTLLHYSLIPIKYTYDNLTEEERDLVTREEFDQLVTWLQAREEEEDDGC